MFVKSITTADYKYTSDKDVELMLGQLLTEFLDSVMCGGSKASVTRRSAGLSILIHRIVAYDMQTGKVSCMRVYPKVSGLAAWSENCKWYSSLPLGAVVLPFCESV
jgi:hypothetical protein